MQQYRSGHNEHDWKSCDGQKPSESSNLSCCARRTAMESIAVLVFCLRRCIPVLHLPRSPALPRLSLEGRPSSIAARSCPSPGPSPQPTEARWSPPRLQSGSLWWLSQHISLVYSISDPSTIQGESASDRRRFPAPCSGLSVSVPGHRNGRWNHRPVVPRSPDTVRLEPIKTYQVSVPRTGIRPGMVLFEYRLPLRSG